MRIFYTYIFSVLCVFTVYTQPTDNATDPPAREASDVLSIYGDTYANVDVSNYDPNWGQSGYTLVNAEFDPGTGSLILAYPNFNYQGTEFAALDGSSMEFLHVDIWVATGINRMVKVSPIDNSGVGAGEVLVEVPLTPGSWNSVDLPKSAFANMSWNSVFQMKFDGQFNGDGSANTAPYDIYLDNIYFWKTATAPGTDVTLSDLQVDGTTIAGFATAKTSYSIGLPSGTVDVPQVTLVTTTDANATSSITQATSIPGDATINVTGGNGTTMQTYTISFFIGSPNTSPPSPTIDAGNVISIYSDAYTNINGINYDPNWGQSGHTLVNPDFDPGTGDLALAYPKFNYQGTEFNDNAQDVSGMDFLHVDIWVASGVDRMVKVSPIDNSGVGAPEILVEVPLTPGSWNSVNLPKSAFADMSWNSVIQMKFDGQFNSDGSANTDPFDIYLDNIYFGRGATSNEEPAIGAPDPTDPESAVISLFSDAYTDVMVDTWNTEWSAATFEDVMIDGNPTKKYTALGFNGIETINAPIDVSEMMHFNMDIWTPNMTDIKIKLVDFLGDGFGGTNGDTEAEITLPVTQGEWQKIKIPLSDFTDAGMTSLVDMNQYIITSEPFGIGIVYIDNVYFSKMSSSSEDLDEKKQIQVYPNPVNIGGTLYLSENAKKIELMSLQGQLLRSTSASSIDLTEVTPGSYVVIITTLEGEKQITKIVVR